MITTTTVVAVATGTAAVAVAATTESATHLKLLCVGGAPDSDALGRCPVLGMHVFVESGVPRQLVVLRVVVCLGKVKKRLKKTHRFETNKGGVVPRVGGGGRGRRGGRGKSRNLASYLA